MDRKVDVLTSWWRRGALWILLGLPVASLALGALAWLRYGIDLPIYDDWFGYVSGLKGSFGTENLFKPLNDTLAPVGYFLDALAQRYLDGNMLPYQLLSMLGVLGGLLWLQWILLVRALGDVRLAAACFVLTLLMLQPGSYWGQQSLAYHQALPLVFILAALALVLRDAAATAWRLGTVALLGLLAGFSYVSGAFAALACGVALWAFAAWGAPQPRRLACAGGAVLAAVGAVAAAAQFVFAVYPNPGLTHRADAPLALPHQADFWLYMAGKLGRALALPPERPLLSLLLVLGVVLLAAVIVACLLRQVLRREPVSHEVWLTAAVLVPLVAAVGAYLMLVAAGRTNLRPPELRSATQVFAFGFERFHFFWATLLWPWLAAALCVLLRAKARGWQSAAMAAGLVAAVVLLQQGVASHFQSYRGQVEARQETVGCLLGKMQRGEVVDCPEFAQVDMAAAYAHGAQMGSSFARTFPVLAMPLGVDDPAPWWRWSGRVAPGDLYALALDAAGPATVLRASGADPQIHFHTGRPDEMARCLMLSVQADMQVEREDAAQLFYRSRGAAGYSEAMSQVRVIAPGAVRRLQFQVVSSEGFEDALRFDPFGSVQDARLLGLEVRCALLRPATRP